MIDMTPIMINEMKIVESMLEANGFATSWLELSNKKVRMCSEVFTNLDISASDNIVSDRIGINTLPRRNAITRDNACKQIN